MLTGEIKKELVVGQVCRNCGYEAGYKNRETDKATEESKEAVGQGRKVKPA
jgi:hypothetical protein